MTHDCSRRSFLQSASLIAAVSGFDSIPAALAAAGTTAASRERLSEFAYSDVQLTGGPIKAQYDFVHRHYLGLDNDRLLKVYRQHAGLPAPGADMGGWYDAAGFVPGHSLGQFISGLARIGSCTGDEACHRKVRELVDGFGAVLAANSNPYAGPGSEKVWPAYVMDKHTIGLLDAYRLSGVESARALLPKMMDGALPFVSPVSRDRIGKKDPPYDETYVLSENLFAAHEITGDRRYYDLAVKYLLNPEFFDPLARGEDVLPEKHAYSHTIALSSAAKAYLVLGDAKYKKALENAWQFLDLQRYASGGVGPDEQFVETHQGKLYESLSTTKAHFETPCGSYAGTKLSRYLLRFTGDARYGDGLERVVYNALLGVKQPDNDGNYPYYSSYHSLATKEHYPHKWPCCSGTLIQSVADQVLNIYFKAADGVYVNLYTPSQVKWAAITLSQEHQYPAEDVVALRVETKSPKAFAVNLRIPGWLTETPSITVNGRAVKTRAQPGTFAAIKRMWRDGDRIELRLPQTFRTESIDDKNPNVVAVMRGPLLYAGLNPWPEVASTPLPLPAGLKAVDGQTETYTQDVNGKPLTFVPLFKVQDQTYDTYFRRA
jgi:DUF1680 family protein